jgi:hypothetical protein
MVCVVAVSTADSLDFSLDFLVRGGGHRLCSRGFNRRLSQPITHSPFPITNYPLPITHSPLPITHSQLPIPHYRCPITHSPFPITHSPLPMP